VTLAVRIQHHVSRAVLLPRLLAALTDFDDVKVIEDPGAHEKPDHWRAHRACLLAMPESVTHIAVLQDDALPGANFSAKLCTAIGLHPESILLAFVPGFPRERRIMMMAKQTGASFAPFIVGAYVPTVAIVYPREVVKGLLAWADVSGGDRFRRPLRGADDGVLAHYCRLRRIRPLCLVPSIVEHDETVESVGKQTRSGLHRRAALI
jgi:hypothetical protein